MEVEIGEGVSWAVLGRVGEVRNIGWWWGEMDVGDWGRCALLGCGLVGSRELEMRLWHFAGVAASGIFRAFAL